MSITIIDESTKIESVKIGVVVSRWNSSITGQMLKGALKVLNGNGIKQDDITVVHCPGSFEIPLTAQYLLQKDEIAGVIALGVVIRGGTPHFEYVCDAVTRGVIDLNLKYNKPVAFGVLTTDNVKQALERAGGKGNKGGEATLAMLEMIAVNKKLYK